MIEIKEIKRNFKSMYLLIIAIFVVVTLSFMIQGSSEIITNMNKSHYNKVGTISFYSLEDKYDKLRDNLNTNDIEKFRLKMESPKEINYEFIGEGDISEFFLVNKDSFNIKDNEIIIPTTYALYNDKKVGDKITIKNNDLNILGFSDDSSDNSFLINLETAKQLNLKIDSLELNLSNDLTDVEKNNFVEKLSNNLESEAFSNIEYRSTFERTNARITIIILISIFSMISIYTNILNERKEKYYIFKFSGMKKFKFFKILLTELIFVYLFSFLLSLVIFYSVNSYLLKEVFGILRYDLTLSSILHVFFDFFIILLIFMNINIAFYFKKSLIEGFKEGRK